MPSPLDLPFQLGGQAVRPTGPPAWPSADPAVLAAVDRCMQTGNWGRYHGDNCRALEHHLADFHAAEHVLLCSSGTAAVELALRGLQISQGDEVILAGYDFKGNFLNVLTFGALPILVDVSPQSGQLDLQRVEAAISSRTRAVIASHLHGGVVDLVRLRQLADSHGFAIIEDACQMPGAPLAGLRAGMSGDVGVISFGGSKLLSAGRGGAVLTNRADVAARIRKHVLRGNSAYPLSELQAAVLLPQLEQLDARRARRSAVVADLFARLAAVPMLAPFSLPTRGVEPDYYKVVLRYDASACGGLSREMFAAAMRAEGMAVSPGFRALHLIHARSRFRAADELTQATLADQNWLVLHHPLLLEGVPAVDEFLAAAQKIQAYADQLRTMDAPRSTRDSLREMDT